MKSKNIKAQCLESEVKGRVFLMFKQVDMSKPRSR